MTLKYKDLVKKALSNVSQDYFNLKVTYDSLGIVRERIFCYELYHQLRLLEIFSSIKDKNLLT